MTNKPHIFRANGGWVCQCSRNGWHGKTPRDAYIMWKRVTENTWATFKEQPK